MFIPLKSSATRRCVGCVVDVIEWHSILCCVCAVVHVYSCYSWLCGRQDELVFGVLIVTEYAVVDPSWT